MNERLASVLLGLSFIAAGVRALVGMPGLSASAVGAVLSLLVGGLFVGRGPIQKAGSTRAAVVALPSLLLGSLALQLAGTAPLSASPVAAVVLAFGLALAVWSLLTLGRNFAIFPALRSVVTGGPFRLLRHPTYAGQLLIVVGCLGVAGLGFVEVAILVGATLWLAARISVEEALLRVSPEYRSYMDRVRWRLVPGIW